MTRGRVVLCAFASSRGKTNPSFSKEGSLSAFGFIRGMKMLPNWVVYEEAGSCQSPNLWVRIDTTPTPPLKRRG